MKILDLLNTETMLESFDTKIDSRVVLHNKNHYVIETDIDNQKIIFTSELVNSDDEDMENVWTITFSTIVDGKQQYGRVKTNASFKIFSFVLQEIVKFVSLYKPRGINFEADGLDKSRVSLYKKLARQKIPDGYELKRITDFGPKSVFWIIKNGAFDE